MIRVTKMGDRLLRRPTSRNTTINVMSFFADPAPYFDQWREQGPLLTETPDGQKSWVISRYDDVVQALGHPGRPLHRQHVR